jgi:hypothetical protein
MLERNRDITINDNVSFRESDVFYKNIDIKGVTYDENDTSVSAN